VKKKTISKITCHGEKIVISGMVLHPIMGILPMDIYIYINPYEWIDDHPPRVSHP
jgi:hypothetical protein